MSIRRHSTGPTGWLAQLVWLSVVVSWRARLAPVALMIASMLMPITTRQLFLLGDSRPASTTEVANSQTCATFTEIQARMDTSRGQTRRGERNHFQQYRRCTGFPVLDSLHPQVPPRVLVKRQGRHGTSEYLYPRYLPRAFLARAGKSRLPTRTCLLARIPPSLLDCASSPRRALVCFSKVEIGCATLGFDLIPPPRPRVRSLARLAAYTTLPARPISASELGRTL